MAFRIASYVIGGEIDNTIKGRVTGVVRLAGHSEPVRLLLAGNCLRDIAGFRVVFRNPSPIKPEAKLFIGDLQEGQVGDITASRKVRVPACPVEEFYKHKGNIPCTLSNAFYLEWFSHTNGRVVIESVEFKITIAEGPTWEMTKGESEEQARSNTEAIKKYIDRASSFLEDDEPWMQSEDANTDAYKPMNEFQWEKEFRQSDALTDKYSALLDKYMDHPEREKIVAREMGWDWLDDALDADERGAFKDESEQCDSLPPLEPNPLTHGTDWIRTDRGRVTHPLTNRAFDLAISMWRRCDERKMLGKGGDQDLHDMVFHAQTLSAKLAGALDSLAYDSRPEGGFIVACLKRALKYAEESLASSRKVESKRLLSPRELGDFRTELFAIREEMLKLMQRFRTDLSC